MDGQGKDSWPGMVGCAYTHKTQKAKAEEL